MMNHAWLDLISLNPVEIKYRPFMISLDIRSGSCKRYVFKKKQQKT